MTVSSRDQFGRSLVTRSLLREQLCTAGLTEGAVVCAHVGMSKLGYVCGAAQTIIDALLDCVGASGGLMMPAFSGELSDPATWSQPPVPSDWIEIIRAETPPFDSRRTPTRQMGVVAELFRNIPGALRSAHPHSSFAAAGSQAPALAGSHPLPYRFGPASPLGKLAALDGKVLLLGAGPDRASFVYLAQYLAGIGAIVTKSVPMMVSGRTVWVDYEDFAVENRLVRKGVEHLIASGIATTHPVGDTEAVLIPVRDSLAALLDWRWRDVDPQPEVVRPLSQLPSDWSHWLTSNDDLY
jgi:aminoglycoside 3-N-acetyltransferase